MKDVLRLSNGYLIFAASLIQVALMSARPLQSSFLKDENKHGEVWGTPPAVTGILWPGGHAHGGAGGMSPVCGGSVHHHCGLNHRVIEKQFLPTD